MCRRSRCGRTRPRGRTATPWCREETSSLIFYRLEPAISLIPVAGSTWPCGPRPDAFVDFPDEAGGGEAGEDPFGGVNGDSEPFLQRLDGQSDARVLNDPGDYTVHHSRTAVQIPPFRPSS